MWIYLLYFIIAVVFVVVMIALRAYYEWMIRKLKDEFPDIDIAEQPPEEWLWWMR